MKSATRRPKTSFTLRSNRSVRRAGSTPAAPRSSLRLDSTRWAASAHRWVLRFDFHMGVARGSSGERRYSDRH